MGPSASIRTWWRSPHRLPRVGRSALGPSRQPSPRVRARERETPPGGEGELSAATRCANVVARLGSDDGGRATTCRTRATCSRRPPFPGEPCGAACSPRRSGEVRAFWATLLSPPAGLWLFSAYAARLLPHRAVESFRVAFSRYRIARKERAVRAVVWRKASTSRAASPFRARLTTMRACKTVPVTPGPHLVQESRLEPKPHQPLGAPRADSEELGPITPELVLVDPVLAELARTQLPEPREQTRPRRRIAASSAGGTVGARPKAVSPRSPRSRPRRWRRITVLAALVFAAGAAFGGLFKTMPGTSTHVTLEVEAGAAPTTTSTRAPKSTRGEPSSDAPDASRRRLSKGRRTASATAPKRQRRRVGRTRPIWSANVLGVTAAVDVHGVLLVWQRPLRFDQVVVFRTPGTRERSDIVYRGRATSYRDLSTRPCTAYRYLIVNYDLAGHRSTGVPTSVVTEGCT